MLDTVAMCVGLRLVVLGSGNSLLDVFMNAHAARVEDTYWRSIFAGFHAFWSIGGLAGSGIAAMMVLWQVPMAWSAAGKKQPESPGQAIAAVAACGYVGFLTGPVIIGGLTGWLGLPFALACVPADGRAIIGAS